MEDTETNQEPNVLKRSLTIFGIPIIRTKCQRDAFLYGLTGGIGMGLVTFLFTSHAVNSRHVAVGSYVFITLTWSCYCCYTEYKMRKEVRLIRRAILEAQAEEI